MHRTSPEPGAPRRAGAGLVLIAALAVAAGFFFLRSRPDVEGLVPLARETRIPLMFALDRAVQEEGFPPDRRFLVPFTAPERNADDPGIPFPMPLSGSVVFEDVPLHAEARLVFGYGIDLVTEAAAAGAEVAFTVAVRERSGARVEHGVFRAVLAIPPAGAEPLRARAEAALPEALRGQRVDLVFRTACARAFEGTPAVPVFTSPVVHSRGREERVAALTRPVARLVDDLLARFEQAVEQDDELEVVVSGAATPEHCFAIKRYDDGREELLPRIGAAVAPAFATTRDTFGEAAGGSWPALAFGLDGTLVRYAVEVPPDGASLEFATGVDHRAIGAGSVRFVVEVDGESVLDETLDPGLRERDRGWHPHAIDLARWAGRTVRVAFAGEVGRRGDVEMHLDERQPVGPPVPFTLTVKWPQGAFARPRVVQHSTVPRRLARKDRPSVLLLNVETFRADAISCAGGPEGITPAIDRLAAEGLRADACIAVAPWTSPSVASLMTGLYPASHGVTSHARSFLAEGLVTLAERASAAGVTTFAMSSNELVSERRNFDQGFEDFLLVPFGNARQLGATIEDWLADHADLQFFAYVHLFEPHHPYNAPGEDRERYVPAALKGRDPQAALDSVLGRILAGDPPGPDDDDVALLRGLYFGEVRYLDRQIERVMEAVRRARLDDGRLVIVLTGDHGEEFCEHGMIGHSRQVYGESVRVPLIVWGRGHVAPASRVAGPVENASLYATVLELLGVPYNAATVRPPIPLRDGSAGGLAYSSTTEGIRRVEPPHVFTRTMHLVRTPDHSLIYSPMAQDATDDPSDLAILELYDLARDPGETTDLRDAEPKLLERMKELLRKAHRAAHRFAFGLAGALSQDTHHALDQLGYVSGTPTDDPDALFPPGERVK